MQRSSRSFAKRRTRAAILGLIGTCLLAGCMTTKTVTEGPEVLRQEIRAGELVKPGDRVSVVTTRTGEHVFTVAEVDADVIRGKGIEVPIDDVVALQKHQLDVVKTAAAAGGVYVGLGALFALAFAIALGDI